MINPKLIEKKSRMKVKSDEKHKDQEKLVCIRIDGKIDKDTLMYREVMDENGETKLKKGKGEEHHLTFTKEPRTESGTCLTHRVIPVHSVLKEFNSFTPGKLSLLIIQIQIQVAKETLLGSLRIKLRGNCTPLVVHSIRISFLSKGSKTLMAVPKVQLLSLVHLEDCETDHHGLTQVEFTQLSGPLGGGPPFSLEWGGHKFLKVPRQYFVTPYLMIKNFMTPPTQSYNVEEICNPQCV